MKVNLGPRRRARIEILPLIDIVFLLLVFFIYAMLSMAVHRGVPVILPTSSSARIERE
ncbi:MAG: biopolymer transporter ExbD, partial [Deltaproteobacteria bacterium]|nr:biopolymer transporter ExbD [Deltaproteobacteria bacterium]